MALICLLFNYTNNVNCMHYNYIIGQRLELDLVAEGKMCSNNENQAEGMNEEQCAQECEDVTAHFMLARKETEWCKSTGCRCYCAHCEYGFIDNKDFNLYRFSEFLLTFFAFLLLKLLREQFKNGTDKRVN